MTRVVITSELGDGVTLTSSRDLDAFACQIGAWWVELRETDLVVRPVSYSVTAGVELLRVPADIPDPVVQS